MNDFQTFADNYTSADYDRIKFDWNGQHADKFHDSNNEFRFQLCEYLIPQLDKVKLDLIRDLYIELSKCAKETWGVYTKYHLFAQQLLGRGGTNYILDYLEGSYLSFDTVIASGQLELTSEQKKTIVRFITDKLKTEHNEKTIKLLQLGIERFERT